jgi:hypothetical protein
MLAFDFAGLDDFFGEALQVRFGSQGEAQALHASDKPALKVPDST